MLQINVAKKNCKKNVAKKKLQQQKNVANIRGKNGISYRFFFSKFAVAQFFNICNIFCCNFFLQHFFFVARFCVARFLLQDFCCNISCCNIYLQHLFATFCSFFYNKVTHMYKYTQTHTHTHTHIHPHTHTHTHKQRKNVYGIP